MPDNNKAWLKRNWPWLATAAMVAVAVLLLRLEGRRWFCKCENVRVWIADAYSSHASQHLVVPYSFSHVQHGLALFWALAWLCPRWSLAVRCWAAIAIEAGWEVLENSPPVIERYRTATAALGYEGDSVFNATADILACAVGLFLARWLGWRRSLVLFIVIEVSMILTIRDSLLLNILMLLMPIEAIAQWQTANIDSVSKR